MRTLFVLFKTELTLALREFSGVLFGMIMPLGIMMLLGILYNNKPAFEGADYTMMQQAFPAVMTIGICATGLMSIPLTIAGYREKKILKRFKVTPTSPAVLIGAQFLSNLVTALISSLIVCASAVLVFDYSFRGSLFPFITSYFLVLASIYSIGILIASLSPNMKTANILCSIAYFPMLFLSGATIPYEIMPAGLQKVSSLMPMSQGIILLKGISLDIPVFSPVKPVIILALTALICTAVSVRIFRWE
ncbi:MAG: ABC transporter permease [Spirochaetales bacterium]|nr:ABC transporter permease [Spirochaetales bacterium]